MEKYPQARINRKKREKKSYLCFVSSFAEQLWFREIQIHVRAPLFDGRTKKHSCKGRKLFAKSRRKIRCTTSKIRSISSHLPHTDNFIGHLL